MCVQIKFTNPYVYLYDAPIAMTVENVIERFDISLYLGCFRIIYNKVKTDHRHSSRYTQNTSTATTTAIGKRRENNIVVANRYSNNKNNC